MFKEFLKRLVHSVEGALGAVIMGIDGISVDEYCEKPDLDVQMIGIEFSSIVKEMNRVSSSIDSGHVDEIMVVADNRAVLVRKISDEYFIALVLNGMGNLGKGRFKLKIMVPQLATEFE